MENLTKHRRPTMISTNRSWRKDSKKRYTFCSAVVLENICAVGGGLDLLLLHPMMQHAAFAKAVTRWGKLCKFCTGSGLLLLLLLSEWTTRNLLLRGKVKRRRRRRRGENSHWICELINLNTKNAVETFAFPFPLRTVHVHCCSTVAYYFPSNYVLKAM